jgi:hypothetical protein
MRLLCDKRLQPKRKAIPVDKFVSMEFFVAVVEAGSLTAATERFDISSALVGKHSAHSKHGSRCGF